MKRRAIMAILAFLIGIPLFVVRGDKTSATGADSLTIVRNGEPNAVVVVPPDPAESKKTPNWTKWTNYEGTTERIEGTAHSGFASLSMNDMKQGGVYQMIDIKPGPVAAQLYFFTPAASAGRISIGMNLRGDDNKNLSTIRSEWASLSAAAGRWASVSLNKTIPEKVNDIAVKKAQVFIFVENGEGTQVYADDYLVYQDDPSRNLLLNPGIEQFTSSLASPLVEYVKKSSGVTLPVVTSQPSGYGGVKIYIGMSRPEDDSAHQALLRDMNEHGFIIDAKEDAVTIIGKTLRATEFGISEFLERYLGVRWLMPGPDGEHVPALSVISVPRELVRQEPATISRHFFGTEGPASFKEWAKRNRMDHNIQFHHNMNNLFDPKVFADHPEYYVGGVVPTDSSSWQPCFNDATAEEAIRRIKEYFSANPQASSYSLGINDGVNYCEGPGHPDYPTRTNSVGYLHRSDYYYRWVNKIAEGVTRQFPDKYFGLLAYREMYDPPMNPDGTPLRLHPNVIPYITDDRMSWIDPPIGDGGKQHTENWLNSASRLGWYEYLYGSPYNVPRMYPHQMAENYRYASEHGVIGHVAELYPNFGEGPKPWVSAKLQWNPNQDVDQLLQEWYTLEVGERAAPYVRQYYELWEQFWTTRILNSSWYKEWRNKPNRTNYLNLFDQSYLKEVTKADIAESRRLLELAVANADTEKRKARAGLLLRAFEFYEASTLSYPRSEAVRPPVTEQEALTMLDDVIRSYEMGKKRMQLIDEFAGHPTLYLPLKPPSRGGVWNGLQRLQIDALKKYASNEPENGPVRTRLDQFLKGVPEYNISATAVKTTSTKAEIMQSLDFSQGPWRNAKPFNEFLVMNTSNSPPAQTKVYLLWDDENLYVGYENFDNNLSKMIVSDDSPNGWWRSGADDSVETYVTADPQGAYTGYFVNPKGVAFVYNKAPNSGPKPGTDSRWEARAGMGTDRWNVVQAIPFASIGVVPSETPELRGFFFRNYHGKSAYLGWGGGAPWKSESFGPIHLELTDTEAPTTSAQVSGVQANGWYTGDVTLTLSAVDAMSPIAKTEYSLDGGNTWQLYTEPVTFRQDGKYNVSYRSTDRAGNAETAKHTGFEIDKTPPTATVAYSSTTPTYGSVVASITPSEQVTVTNNGGASSYTFLFNGSFTFEFVDAAGHAGKATATVTNIVYKSTGVPGKPVLSDDNGQDTGILDGDYKVNMNMWWGNNGKIYKLYENDALIDTQIFADGSPSAQSAVTSVTYKKNGTYRYYAELTNAFGTTRSDVLTVTVLQATPAKPVLSNDNWDGDGNFKVNMNMWWGTNGTTYRLYENGVLIDTQTLADGTPSAQSARTTIVNKKIGTYEYRCELINSAGITSSEPMIVRVVK